MHAPESVVFASPALPAVVYIVVTVVAATVVADDDSAVIDAAGAVLYRCNRGHRKGYFVSAVCPPG
jgi:hypothetical protein